MPVIVNELLNQQCPQSRSGRFEDSVELILEIVVRLVAVETLTLSARCQSNGGEWVGYRYYSVITPNHPWSQQYAQASTFDLILFQGRLSAPKY
jgi:hypothetical protein